MNKKEYIKQIERELDKYILNNYNDLIYQVRDVINQIDEDNIEEILGSPEVYVAELFELNEMEPQKKQKQDIKSNAKIGFVASIFLTSLAILLLSFNIEQAGTILDLASKITLLLIAFGTLVNVIKKQSSVHTLTLILTIIAVVYSAENFHNIEGVSIQVLFIMLLTFGLVNLFENIRVRLFRSNKNEKRFRGTFSELYDDETVKVNMSFGSKTVVIPNNIKQVYVKSKFGDINIDTTYITEDLLINVSGKFGQVNITLPENAQVIDNSIIKFGDCNAGNRNGNGPVITINGKYSFGQINY